MPSSLTSRRDAANPSENKVTWSSKPVPVRVIVLPKPSVSWLAYSSTISSVTEQDGASKEKPQPPSISQSAYSLSLRITRTEVSMGIIYSGIGIGILGSI